MTTSVKTKLHDRKNKDMHRRVLFFFRHAGWSYDPKTQTSAQGRYECALDLARAEVWRERKEGTGKLRVRWEYDSIPYEMGDAETERPQDVLVCMVEIRKRRCPRHPGFPDLCDCPDWDTVASLGGIGDPDRNYRRVVEAELCYEAWV